MNLAFKKIRKSEKISIKLELKLNITLIYVEFISQLDLRYYFIQQKIIL